MTDRSRRYNVSTFRPNKFPNSSRSVYASAPFKFIVDDEPLYIHADLVSLHSKLLDDIMNGPMADAQKGSATLKDVDEGTFVRFIEWAHKGYYTAAELTTVEIEVVPAAQKVYRHRPVMEEPSIVEAYALEAPPAEADALVELPWPQSKKDKKKGKKFDHNAWESEEFIVPHQQSRGDAALEMKRELKEAFFSRSYTVRRGVTEIPPPRRNQNPEEDYTYVFLSHAQLYVFAEKYDIQRLKVLALEELHATLAIYTLYPVRTGDIIALLRYVYGNTAQSNGGEEDLRNVLTSYIGYEMDTLMGDDDFRDLMVEDGGPLLGDFMKMVKKRISSSD